ncbi:MAG: Uma2 family endonuclease [Planctomycetes bacterium]|nr:Uma2 family endonuclease [Planctomycetota bacterium]
MTLEEFAQADGQSGHVYELAGGEVVVVEIPGLPHGLVVDALQRQVQAYRVAHPGLVYYVASGSDCALRLPAMQSERHPDLSLYLTPPPDPIDPWDAWVPDIAIEVVSAGQERRDYEEKRREYLAAGVREYWIVDPAARSVLVLDRRGDEWAERRLGAADRYRTGRLPGFELDVAALFAALG